MTSDSRLALSDTNAAALTAFGEARNQPILGVVAVLSVIENRRRLGRWGQTYAKVVLATSQFSCWNKSDPNAPVLNALAAQMIAGTMLDDDPVLDVCLFLAEELTNGRLADNTKGATHYFNPSVVTPAWAQPPAMHTVTIGGHAFYKGVR